MATAERLSDNALPNVPSLEVLETQVRDFRDLWLPHVPELLGWAERWVAGWNSHDIGALTKLVAEDLVWDDPVMRGETITGRDAFKAYIETFWTGLPDVQFIPTGRLYFATDGLGMAVPWRMVGTFTGELAWWGKIQGDRTPSFAPTGRTADIEGFDVYDFHDGLLSHYTIVCDFLTLSQQLGLAPPPDSPLAPLMLRWQRLTAPLVRRRSKADAN